MAKQERYEVRIPLQDELDQVQRLRHRVLDPARPAPSDTALSPRDFDLSSIHMAVFADGKIVSTVRIDPTEEPNVYNVRKMATAIEHQGRNLGSMALHCAEQEAIMRGAREFTLGSRTDKVGFYEKNGYYVAGESYVSPDGLSNIPMQKEVREAEHG
jgi:predicted GNAT family N-acyltransferase